MLKKLPGLPTRTTKLVILATVLVLKVVISRFLQWTARMTCVLRCVMPLKPFWAKAKLKCSTTK